MKTLAVVAILLASGCYDFTPVANQDAATQEIWNICYGESHAPPGVDWMRNGRTGILQSGEHSGEYEKGYYDLIYAHVELPDSAWYTYAHELYHAHLFLSTGNADPGHSDSGWGITDSQAANRLQLMGIDGPME